MNLTISIPLYNPYMKSSKKVSISQSRSKSKKTPKTKRSVAATSKLLEPNASMIKSVEGFYSIQARDYKK